MNGLFREITPLAPSDCFLIATRIKTDFRYPLHYHEEIELNLIQNAGGIRRVVGDHIGEIGDLELVLVGSNLQHAWLNGHMRHPEATEVTIQFHKDLFNERFLGRNQLSFLRNLFEMSACGVLFSQRAIRAIMPRIKELNKKLGFDSVLELMRILFDLSTDQDVSLLSDSTFNPHDPFTYNSRRIGKTMEYMNEHFSKQITLAEMAGMINMTESAFSRFFKVHTGMTFIDALTEKRLGHVSRLLVETNQSVAEIADSCGFNNMSHFNRVFKKKKGVTPKEFREHYGKFSKVFV